MICRLCLKETENALNFFDEAGNKMNVANVIGKYFWFEPRHDDPISNVICNSCWSKVAEFDDFYKSVEAAEKAHYNLKFPMKSENPNEKIRIRFDNVLSNNVELAQFDVMNEREIPIHVMGIVEGPGTQLTQVDNCPLDVTEDNLNILSNKLDHSDNDQVPATIEETKKNQEIINSNNNNSANNGDSLNDKLPGIKLKRTELIVNIKSGMTRRRGRPRKNSTHKEQFKPVNINTIKVKRGRPSSKMNLNETEEDEEKKERNLPEESKPNHAKSAASDAEIAKYMSLHCELCNIEMEKFTALKIHMRVKHKIIGYVKCCDKKFLKRQLLLEHIRKHLNPDCYKCDDCNRIFSDKQSMRNHFLVKHQKDEDKLFECADCSKKFARKYLLEQHKVYAHRDRSTTCKRCNRRFATVEELNVHNRVRCFGTMCEICARVIRGSAAFQRHQAEHMGIVLPKVQCDECGSWHKDKYALNKHKKRHIQAKETHVCNLCQKITPNRSALLSHISFVHDDKRCYECNICKKRFKKAIYLREHMAGHTGEVLYRCPHCPKTFNSNANMHSHRKKVHPQEFEEMRKLRQQSAHLSIPPIPTIAEMSRKKNSKILQMGNYIEVNTNTNANSNEIILKSI